MALLLPLCAALPAQAGVAQGGEIEISGGKDCRPDPSHEVSLRGDVKLQDALKVVAEGTCERFLVPKSMASLHVDLADRRMVVRELGDFVRSQLRNKGIVLDSVTPTWRLRQTDYKPTEPVPAETLDRTISCKENRCTIARSTFEAVLRDTEGLARSARIVPAVENGKPSGFKIFAVRPGSYFARLGFENGDLIRKVDEFEMTDTAKMLEAYTKLRGRTSVRVEVVRRGKAQTMEYVIN
jgi:hypothetical protein